MHLKKYIGESCWAFSICGLVIYFISLPIFYFALKIGFDQFIAAIIFFIINLFLTGAIHEDGLADLADGMFVGKNIKTKLKIMNDSRIGVFGVLAIVIIFNLKIFSIAYVTPQLNNYIHLILIAMVSRYCMLFFLRFLKPLKKDGLGKGFTINENKTLIIGFLPIIPFIFFLNLSGLVIVFVMLISSLIFFLIIKKKFRGQTGDICGANQQINEVIGLLTLTLI